MISDSEFVLITNFDRTIQQNVDAAQRIIDTKNRLLMRSDAEIVRLRAALANETGARRLAQLQQTTGQRRLAALQARRR